MTKHKKYHGLLVKTTDGYFLYLSNNDREQPYYKQYYLRVDSLGNINYNCITIKTYVPSFSENEIDRLCSEKDTKIIKSQGRTICQDCYDKI